MACTDYRVDLVAAKFGDCKCGYPKPAHVRSPSGQGSQGTAVDSAVTTKSDDSVPTWRKEAQAAKLRRKTAVGDAIGRPSENPTVILNWQQEVAGKKARRKTTTGSTCAVAPTPTAGASIFTSAFTSALKRTEGGIDVRPPATEYTEPTHVNKAPVSREAAMLDGRGLPRAEKLQSMPKVGSKEAAVAPTPLRRTEGGIDVRPPVTEYTEPTHVNKAPVRPSIDICTRLLYAKMLEVGLPEQVVRQRMQEAGTSAADTDAFFRSGEGYCFKQH
jgi:hypothetical protein